LFENGTLVENNHRTSTTGYVVDFFPYPFFVVNLAVKKLTETRAVTVFASATV
jgi:uncharacterized membrane protein